ncbi:MAG: thioredoxin domain-containing protein [Planctomycetes bacterium]|nr:thioredoxin domain-containing protein [Planctomycetota bacterium]
MEWLEWSDEAFATARKRGAPVLLYLKASWCRWCRELETRVFDDPRVVATLASQFVAVRVDKDRRPDIDARYSRGGWPTIAYLDESGELIARDSFLEADELLARLDLVAGYWADNKERVRRRLTEASDACAAPARARGELSHQILDDVAHSLLETADPVHGGWGAQHKFPHPEGLDYALLRWSQTGDEAMRKLVLRTLRNMQAGEIHDRVEGGFYRYATAADWSGPHHEKVLDSNAQRLYAYLEGYQALGEASFRETAEGILRWMDETLLDHETGAYRGSQDASAAYAHLATREARRAHGAPACDPTIFTNWNALAASSLFKASAVLDRPELAERARGVLEFLFDELYDERVGMHHYWDGTYHLPGMLTDQAHTLRALIDSVQFSGCTRSLERAEHLAEIAARTLASDDGGFWDMRHDPAAHGSLRRRTRSILENSIQAEALLRLSFFTRELRWQALARETLASFASDYKRHGHLVAGYARAVDLYLHPPVHVTIVGPAERDDTRHLRRAALAPYVASRVVQVIDPLVERGRLERLGLPYEGGASRAYVSRGRESYAETSDPLRLPALMTRIERGA